MRSKLGLAFVERCGSQEALPALIEEFRRVSGLFGFTIRGCGGWAGLGKSRTFRLYFHDWTEAWLKAYAEQNLFERDPVVMESRRRMTPFTWSEIEDDPWLRREGAPGWEIAAREGLKDGFAVPIHGPAGYQGLVSLAGPERLDLDTGERAVLRLMAHTIHDRCRSTVGFGALSRPLPDLTPRQLECLQWAAEGKTDWEIGQLLGISESTAHYHIEQAKKRLGATTRVQAIALLVLEGLI